MPEIEITHYVVDQLPHGAAVLVVDEAGTIAVYMSRAHTLDRIAADLTATIQALSDADYERTRQAG